MGNRKYDLKDRLIDYAVRIIKLSSGLPDTKAGRHVASQILRSGTAPAPNYGEAQSAESKADFVHKLKIAMKELRETEMWLRIIARAGILRNEDLLSDLLRETDELMAIMYTSIKTAKRCKQSDEC